mgnify:CR=1 FL=1
MSKQMVKTDNIYKEVYKSLDDTMKSMQKENKNKDVLSNSMAMFLILNTASIQIIPTTVIAIRNSLGSNNPTGIVFPVWIATICAAVSGIIATKIFINITGK